MGKKLYYAVLRDHEDTDHGTGSFDRAEAIRMAKKLFDDDYVQVRIAVIDPDDDFCLEEISTDEIIMDEEMDPEDPSYNWDYGYAELKADILAQAEEKGIDKGMLVFQYDGQENEPKDIDEDILYSVRRYPD